MKQQPKPVMAWAIYGRAGMHRTWMSCDECWVPRVYETKRDAERNCHDKASIRRVRITVVEAPKRRRKAK